MLHQRNLRYSTPLNYLNKSTKKAEKMNLHMKKKLLGAFMVLCGVLTIALMALEVAGNLFSSEKKMQYAGVCKNDRRLLSESYKSLWVNDAQIKAEMIQAEQLGQWERVRGLRKERLRRRLRQIVHHANRQETKSLDGTRPGSLVSIYFYPKYEMHRFAFHISEGPEDHQRFFELDIVKEFKIMKIAAQFARDTEISLPVEIMASAAGFRGIWTDPNQKQIELTMEIVTGTDGAAEWLKISWNPQQFRLIDIHWTHEFIVLLN